MNVEALLSDTDWTYEDELELLKEEITQIADQLRADETKKMLILLEVCYPHCQFSSDTSRAADDLVSSFLSFSLARDQEADCGTG